MPIRNGLYDFMQLSAQVSEAAKSHSRNNTRGLTRGEFLSGFNKEDNVVPVITLVVYWGTEEWDAPVSLREMYSIQDEKLLDMAADYKINLIYPNAMKDMEIDCFRTDLKEVFYFIKYSADKDKLMEIVSGDDRYKHMDRIAVEVINSVTNSKIRIREDEEVVDMCQAMIDLRLEGEQIGNLRGIIRTCMKFKLAFDEIVKNVMEDADLTEEEAVKAVREYWEK